MNRRLNRLWPKYASAYWRYHESDKRPKRWSLTLWDSVSENEKVIARNLTENQWDALCDKVMSHGWRWNVSGRASR